MKAKEEHVPVVVVGAGPAGLTAAIALARAGIETLLLERRLHTSRLPRANVVSTSTLELMRSWGLEEQVREGDLQVELQPWVTETLATARHGHAVDAGLPDARAERPNQPDRAGRRFPEPPRAGAREPPALTPDRANRTRHGGREYRETA